MQSLLSNENCIRPTQLIHTLTLCVRNLHLGIEAISKDSSDVSVSAPREVRTGGTVAKLAITHTHAISLSPYQLQNCIYSSAHTQTSAPLSLSRAHSRDFSHSGIHGTACLCAQNFDLLFAAVSVRNKFLLMLMAKTYAVFHLTIYLCACIYLCSSSSMAVWEFAFRPFETSSTQRRAQTHTHTQKRCK